MGRSLSFLKKLTEAPGVPGREERIRAVVEKEAKDLFDESWTDPMGNLIGVCRAKSRKKKKAPRKVMLACHLDEIGFYVKFVDDKGFLRLQNVGGFDTRNLFSRRVLVQGAKGDLIGVMNPSGKPIHIATEEEKKKTYEIGEFYVDLFMDKKEADKRVQIGDPVTILQETIEIGEVVSGKAMDNRVASFVAIESMREAQKKSPFDIYYVGAVQEEVGCRGSGPAAFDIGPDDGIAIDTTLSCDTPGVGPDLAVTRFGHGVALKLMDSGSISTRSLFDEFLELAKKEKIAHQIEILPRGGTDAGSMQRSGAAKRVFTLSVPTRYIHTITEAVHRNDLETAVDLLGRWLKG